MANVYMDPDQPTDGDGSEESPWNTWDSKSFSAGNRYLQKCGTTFTGQLLCTDAGTSEDARIYFGSYGSGPRPILRAGASVARTFQAHNDAHYITIDGYEIYAGAQGGAGTNYAATWGFSVAPAHHGKMVNCIIHGPTARSASAFDHNGVNVFGDYFEMHNTIVDGALEDCVWVSGGYPRFFYNHMRNPDLGGNLLGDCLQLVDPGPYIVIGNFLDHSNTAAKQCFVATKTSAGGGIFALNHCKMKTVEGGIYSCVFGSQANDVFIGNYLEGGNYGFQLVDPDQIVAGNIIVGAERGCVFTSSATSGCKAFHNTFVRCTIYGLYADISDAVIQNNLFKDCATGMARQSTATYSHNAYHGNTTASAFIGSAGSAESDTVTSDPMLNDDYSITIGSPLYNAGVLISPPSRDRFGNWILGNPSIGAHQPVAARSSRA